MTVSHIAIWFGGAPDERGGAAGERTARVRPEVKLERAETESTTIRDRFELALVHQIGVGDERALRALYELIYPTLWDFARSVTESRDAADDFTQEAFTILWNRAPTWDDGAHVRGFLFTAVRNLARNARRRRQFADRAERSHQEEIARMVMAAIPGTPDERVQHRELIATVGRVVAALPEPRRTALLLRWKEQLPYVEIGRVLGVSEVAAQRLVTRARLTVKLHIGPLLDA